jgi:hypothetical protein
LRKFLRPQHTRKNLGRAYALQGDTPKARAAYQDFFALWKDADPDVPILKAAPAEYEKLKWSEQQTTDVCSPP